MDILIFDDDPFCSELIASLAREEGWSVEKYADGTGAARAVSSAMPRLVIADVMMPGMDGHTLTRAIKASASLSHIPVVLVSGKTFAEDRELARRSGAAAFLSKPFDMEKVRQTLLGLLGKPSGPSAAAALPRPPAFQAKVWGCRGEGGDQNTCCVSLGFGKRLVVLDAGTGLRGLAASKPPAPDGVWVLLTHFHPGHVSGIDALKSLAALPGGGRPINLATPAESGQLSQFLAEAAPSLDVKSVNAFRLFEGCYQLWPDVTLSALYARHPGSTLAFRIEHQGRSLVYCPDNEIETPDKTRTDFAEKFAFFVRGADLLIHDARFSDGDYEKQPSQGHGCPRMAVELAQREGVRSLVLFHMDSRYGERELAAMLEESRARLKENFSSLRLELACDGLVLDV
jgi:CheY-like chemotaxis protein/ribonuclease BN (tRNA processing enzyme)